MADLHVFQNDIDSVVAESPEHAVQVMTDLMGEPYETQLQGEFRQLPDEQTKEILFDDEEDAKCCGPAEKRADGHWVVRQTCAEWALLGPSQIGSTEY